MDYSNGQVQSQSDSGNVEKGDPGLPGIGFNFEVIRNPGSISGDIVFDRTLYPDRESLSLNNKKILI